MFRLSALCAAAFLTVSCGSEDFRTNSVSPSETVRFNVRVGQGWSSDQTTRTSESLQTYPEALLLRDGEHPLYLVSEVSAGIAVCPNRNGATRSSLTSNDDIADFGVFASLKPDGTASLSELSPNYMWNVEVKKANGWIPDDHYLWPGTGSLHFNAYSPYVAAITGEAGITSLPSASDKGELYLSYASPLEVDKQQDLLLAVPVDVRVDTCDLVFNHALTAIRFATGARMAPCRIKSVSLTGIQSKGTLNMETGDWSALSDSQTFSVATDIELSADKSGYVASGTPITSESQTFLLIPQTLSEGASISIVLEEYGMETTLETSLAGVQWEAGKTVTYRISADPHLGAFMLDVTDMEGNPLSSLSTTYAGGTLRFKVSSAYGNPTDPANRKDMAWKAEFIDDNGGVISAPKWISKLPMNGSGSATLSASISEVSPVFEGVSQDSEVLRKAVNINESSGYYPFNLANSTGQATVKNTANCYLIHAPGFYSIPLVYGNAVTDGKTNTGAFVSTNTSNVHVLKNMVNHLGSPVTDPYIYNNTGCVPYDAELIWESRLGLIKNVQLSPDKKRLIFVVSPDYICQGNAIVAVRDADGIVLWSWHLWVTPYDPDSDAVTVNYHNKDYQMMTRNIGQVSGGDRVNFRPRSAKLRFTQLPEDGSEPVSVTIPIEQSGKIIETHASYNYYQWGRKDPIISDVAEWYNADAGEITKLWTKNFDSDRTAGIPIIADYIRTPGYFWVSTHSAEVFPHYNLWNTNFSTTDEVKTIYDPSPVGFMVSRNVLTGLQNSPSVAVDGIMGPGVKVTIPSTGQTVFFPAQGYRSDIDGSIQGRDAGSEVGSVWTSRTTSTTDATVLVINLHSDIIQVQGLESRAMGFGVRPAK